MKFVGGDGDDMKLKCAVAKCALQLALPVCLDKPLIWLGQVVKIK